MPRSSGITLDSKALDKQLANAIQRNPAATTKTVHRILLDLAGESARRAPIESGDLRNDCTAELNGKKTFAKQSPIGGAPPASLKAFGSVGYSLPYALRQHEELDYRHDRTDGYRRPDGTTVNMVAGGEAKYLERPFDERVNSYVLQLSKIPEEVLT